MRTSKPADGTQTVRIQLSPSGTGIVAVCYGGGIALAWGAMGLESAVVSVMLLGFVAVIAVGFAGHLGGGIVVGPDAWMIRATLTERTIASNSIVGLTVDGGVSLVTRYASTFSTGAFYIFDPYRTRRRQMLESLIRASGLQLRFIENPSGLEQLRRESHARIPVSADEAEQMRAALVARWFPYRWWQWLIVAAPFVVAAARVLA